MSNADLDLRATQLRQQGVPFVRARVVLAEKPTSAKAGDEAIVHADGSIEGFVGGTCAETTVRAQSLLLLLDTSEPLLLRITPTEEASPAAGDTRIAPGTRTVHNPCLSGGTLEIFLDPVVPPPLVAVHGDGPIAAALTRLAGELGYRAAPVRATDLGTTEIGTTEIGTTEIGTKRFGATGIGTAEIGTAGIGTAGIAGALAVVVASHGRQEVETLVAALDAGVPYIGLVASRRRAAGVLADLAEARPDLADVAVERVHSPAGLDIGATTASEIALSILAEVVTERVRVRSSVRSAPESHRGSPPDSRPVDAVDPICGMTVAAVDTSLHTDHDGQRWYFCGPGCQRAFAAEHLPDPVAGYAAS